MADRLNFADDHTEYREVWLLTVRILDSIYHSVANVLKDVGRTERQRVPACSRDLEVPELAAARSGLLTFRTICTVLPACPGK